MENQFKDIRQTRFFHKPNGPFWHTESNDWGWMLYGNWHRYYGPQNDLGAWFLHGEWTKDA